MGKKVLCGNIIQMRKRNLYLVMNTGNFSSIREGGKLPNTNERNDKVGYMKL